MRSKKVIITGGAGFISSHLAEEPAKDNEVVVIGNLFVVSTRDKKHG